MFYLIHLLQDLPEVPQDEDTINIQPERPTDVEKSPPKRKITRPTM